MSERTFSSYPRTAVLDGTELFAVEQGGALQCLALSTLSTYVTLNSVAAEIVLADLAAQVSLPGLAAEFAVADIAAHIDLTALAAEIDLTTQSGEEVLSADYDLTADNTFEDTGLSIALPAAGTYLVGVNARVQADKDGANDGGVQVRLYDVTAAAVVEDSERMVLLLPATDATARQASGGYTFVVTVAGAHTLRLEAARYTTGTPTWDAAKVKSDANGRTTINYYKVA